MYIFLDLLNTFSTFECAYIKYKLIFTMLLLNFLYYMK